MGVLFVGAGTVFESNQGAAGAVSPHANTQEGDLLFWFHYSAITGGDETATAPDGFTEIVNEIVDDRGLLVVAWKLREQGETSYTGAVTNHGTGSSGETIQEWIEAWRAVDGEFPDDPIGDIGNFSSWAASTTQAGPISGTGIDSVPPACMVYVVAGRHDDLSTVAQDTLTGENLTWIARTVDEATVGADSAVFTQTGINDTGVEITSVNDKTITFASSTSATGVGVMFVVLFEATGSGGPTVVQRTQGTNGETSAQTIQSAQFLPTADALMCVFGWNQNDFHTTTPDWAISNDGGLTFTASQSDPVDWDGDDRFQGRAALFTAPTPTSPVPTVLTLDAHDGSTQPDFLSFVVVEVAGGDVEIVQGPVMAAEELGGGNSESHTTASLPGPATPGNICLLFVGTGNDATGTPSTPAGWTSLGANDADRYTNAVAFWRDDFDGQNVTISDLGQVVGNAGSALIELKVTVDEDQPQADATITVTLTIAGTAVKHAATIGTLPVGLITSGDDDKHGQTAGDIDLTLADTAAAIAHKVAASDLTVGLAVAGTADADEDQPQADAVLALALAIVAAAAKATSSTATIGLDLAVTGDATKAATTIATLPVDIDLDAVAAKAAAADSTLTVDVDAAGTAAKHGEVAAALGAVLAILGAADGVVFGEPFTGTATSTVTARRAATSTVTVRRAATSTDATPTATSTVTARTVASSVATRSTATSTLEP